MEDNRRRVTLLYFGDDKKLRMEIPAELTAEEMADAFADFLSAVGYAKYRLVVEEFIETEE